MYYFGRKSTAQKASLYPWLRLVFMKVLLRHDHSIDQGGRDDDEQWKYFHNGTSTLKPPDGKHLFRVDPSGEFEGKWAFAADVCPYIHGKRLATDAKHFGPNERAQFAFFLSIVQLEAEHVLKGTGWAIRLGINWDMDAEILTDQKFDDWFHVEIVWEGI